MTASQPRRPRFQFTLRQMLLAVFFCALASSALAPIARASSSDRVFLILVEGIVVPPIAALSIRLVCRPSPWTLWFATALGFWPVVMVGGILVYGVCQSWLTDQPGLTTVLLPFTLGWSVFGLWVWRGFAPKRCPACGRPMLRVEGRRDLEDRHKPPYTARCVWCKGRFRRWHLGQWEIDEPSG